MKARNLIDLLQRCNLEDIVVMPGYEGGYNDVEGVRQVELKLNQNTEWYYGSHEFATEGNADCSAILIHA